MVCKWWRRCNKIRKIWQTIFRNGLYGEWIYWKKWCIGGKEIDIQLNKNNVNNDVWNFVVTVPVSFTTKIKFISLLHFCFYWYGLNHQINDSYLPVVCNFLHTINHSNLNKKCFQYRVGKVETNLEKNDPFEGVNNNGIGCKIKRSNHCNEIQIK